MKSDEIRSAYFRALENPFLYWSEIINLDRLLSRKIYFSKEESNFNFETLQFNNKKLGYTKNHVLKNVSILCLGVSGIRVSLAIISSSFASASRHR